MAKQLRFSTDTGAEGRVYFDDSVPHGAWTFEIKFAGLGDESPWFGGYYGDMRDAESDCRHYLRSLGCIMPVQPLRAKGERLREERKPGRDRTTDIPAVAA